MDTSQRPTRPRGRIGLSLSALEGFAFGGLARHGGIYMARTIKKQPAG